MANCTYCNKPIVLIPSAQERASRYGGKPSDYTKLFTYHDDCFRKHHENETRELIKRINTSHPKPVVFRVQYQWGYNQ